MRIINHVEEDSAPAFLDADEKWLDNRLEPIVRRLQMQWVRKKKKGVICQSKKS
jgi:hypothetical protein